MREKNKGVEFSLANNSDHVPEVCNEFVTIYIQENRLGNIFTRAEAIDFTMNLCHWLFEQSFTVS